MRIIYSFCLVLICTFAQAQSIKSIGVFGGFNIPVTVDIGMIVDSRYTSKFTIRETPVGISYGYDFKKIGFVVTPSYLKIGQPYLIKNTVGGEIGLRDIQMEYLSLPVAFKIYIMDMAFFRLSGLVSISANYLLNGKETVKHEFAKVNYPGGISIPQEPGYVVTYDGVFVPEKSEHEYITKDKFADFQVFGGLGLRSDFEISDRWVINFDGRANVGVFETRRKSYLDELKKPTGPPDIYKNPGAPDLPGIRIEMYVSVDFGISYILPSSTRFKAKRTTIKNRSGDKKIKDRNPTQK